MNIIKFQNNNTVRFTFLNGPSSGPSLAPETTEQNEQNSKLQLKQFSTIDKNFAGMTKEQIDKAMGLEARKNIETKNNYQEILNWFEKNCEKTFGSKEILNTFGKGIEFQVVNNEIVMQSKNIYYSTLLGFLNNQEQLNKYLNNKEVKETLMLLSSDNPAEWNKAYRENYPQLSPENKKLVGDALQSAGSGVSIKTDKNTEIDFAIMNNSKFRRNIKIDPVTKNLVQKSAEEISAYNDDNQRTTLHELEHLKYKQLERKYNGVKPVSDKENHQEIQVEICLKSEVLAHLFQAFTEDGSDRGKGGWEGIIKNLTEKDSYQHYFEKNLPLQKAIVTNLVEFTKKELETEKQSLGNKFNLSTFIDQKLRIKMFHYSDYKKLEPQKTTN